MNHHFFNSPLREGFCAASTCPWVSHTLGHTHAPSFTVSSNKTYPKHENNTTEQLLENPGIGTFFDIFCVVFDIASVSTPPYLWDVSPPDSPPRPRPRCRGDDWSRVCIFLPLELVQTLWAFGRQGLGCPRKLGSLVRIDGLVHRSL